MASGKMKRRGEDEEKVILFDLMVDKYEMSETKYIYIRTRQCAHTFFF